MNAGIVVDRRAGLRSQIPRDVWLRFGRYRKSEIQAGRGSEEQRSCHAPTLSTSEGFRPSIPHSEGSAAIIEVVVVLDTAVFWHRRAAPVR